MSIRIIVKSTVLDPVNVTTRGGQAMTLRKQTAYAVTVDRNGNVAPYPERIELVLPREQAEPYPVGEYQLHPSSFYVGKFSRLECSPRLAPITTARG